MKKLLTIILLIVSINSYSQPKKFLGAVDSIPVLTPDTTLNTFIYHWLGKPYKLGG
jgi:hypothetical protein